MCFTGCGDSSCFSSHKRWFPPGDEAAWGRQIVAEPDNPLFENLLLAIGPTWVSRARTEGRFTYGWDPERWRPYVGHALKNGLDSVGGRKQEIFTIRSTARIIEKLARLRDSLTIEG
jgi:hypothetical protein